MQARTTANDTPGDSQRVPTWLGTPPSGTVPSPPVETRRQVLPLGELGWEDFERLCVRLVRLGADVEHCQLYGTRGQNQHGIDLFARHRETREYSVYQCKRVEDFGPSAIVEAVDRFLQGLWADRAKTFVLCMTASAVRTEYAGAVEEQAHRLADRGITLMLWDLEEISTQLKDTPELVDDFFGRAWTKAFCGEHSAEALGRRLDATQVAGFRSQLRELYGLVFNLHDPGIPVPPQPGIVAIPLSDRFVVPDVFGDAPSTRGQGGRSGSEDTDLAGQVAEMVPGITPDSQSNRRSARRVHRRPGELYRPREGLDGWLASADRSIILGGPGSGKSSLLRYLVLDLLSDEPSLVEVANRWGTRLPVWVPFGFWTSLIAERPGAQASIGDCLQRWLERWNAGALWPLVQQAIDDERLLLVVDGLDEWTNQDSGRVAVQLLQVFVQTHGVPVIVATRPYGFERLPIHGEGWHVGELAHLSLGQRAQLCARWFEIKATLDTGGAELSRLERDQVQAETTRFLEELDGSPELAELAQVPLLLLVLMYLRFQQLALPRHRFDAYDRLVDHLVRAHPTSRRTAAFLLQSTSGLTDTDMSRVLANLAYLVHVEFPEGIVPESEASRFVADFLADDDLGLGLSAREVNLYTPQFLEIAEGSIGLLVRQGVGALGFFHRSLQEFLAARHLARLDLAVQEEIVQEHGADPRWREVLVGLFWHTSRSKDVERLIDRLPTGDLASYPAAELRAEVGFGDFNCSPHRARSMATDAFREIELGTWMPHRRRLLALALGGLRSTKTRELVRDRVRRWAVARGTWRPSLYPPLAHWPFDEETSSLLITALHDEDDGVQRAAAGALAIAAKGDPETGMRVAELARRSPDPLQRAAGLEALALGWPDHPELGDAVDSALLAPSPDLRISALRARVALGVHDDDDLRRILELVSGEAALTYGPWADAIPSLLIEGWSGNTHLKDACLSGVRRPVEYGEGVANSVAISVLLRAFPQDQEVARWCQTEISQEDHPFLMGPHIDTWRWLAESFRDEPGLVKVIDEWGSKREHDQPAVSFAALLGRTPLMKRKLLDSLDSSLPHWAANALLEGWGIEDPDVERELTRVIDGPPHSAANLAYLIPKVITDPAESKERLLALLRSAGNVRRDMVIAGLAQLPDIGDRDQIADECLQAIEEHGGQGMFSVDHLVITHFHGSPRVREFAIRSLGREEPPISTIARAYAQDGEIRSLLAPMLTPLPVLLRGTILHELAGMRDDDGFASAVLEQYRAEHDDELQVIGSIGYHATLSADEHATATDRLRSDLQGLGFDYEAHRRAAFAGLTVLHRLDVVEEATEVGAPRPLSIGLSYLHSDESLLRLVAEHWDYLHSSFGDALPSRLSGREGSSQLFWTGMCAVAGQFPQTHASILEALDQDPQAAMHESAIRFIQTIRPRSTLLAERCLTALEHVDAWTPAYWSLMATAAGALAAGFGGDRSVRAELNARIHSSLWEVGPLFALCLGWSDDPTIDELYAELEGRLGTTDREPIPYPSYFGLSYTRLPAARLPAELKKHLRLGEQAEARVLDPIVPALIHRLQRDPGAESAIAGILKEDPYPSAKTTVPRLLAAANGLPQWVAEWSQTELRHQLSSGTVPELGFDLLAMEVRSVAHALLDTLGAGQ